MFRSRHEESSGRPWLFLDGRRKAAATHNARGDMVEEHEGAVAWIMTMAVANWHTISGAGDGPAYVLVVA